MKKLCTVLGWVIDICHYPSIVALVLGNWLLFERKSVWGSLAALLGSIVISGILVIVARTICGGCPLSMLTLWLHRKYEPRYNGCGFDHIYDRPNKLIGAIALLLMGGGLSIPYYLFAKHCYSILSRVFQ